MQLITIKENVESQRLLLSCEISSSRSQWFPKRIFMNLVDVLRWSYCIQQSAPACGLTDDCITIFSVHQGCELCSFYLIV